MKEVVMRRIRLMLSVLAITALAAPAAFGADFYVDPVNGDPNGDGSAANPWRTIEEVIDDGLIESVGAGVSINPGAPVTGGDTIYLRSGYHGEIILDGRHNTDTITIAAEPGHTPQVSRIQMRTGRKWTFRGLTISPSFAPTYERTCIVDFFSRFIGVTAYVTIEDCFIYSVLDTSAWSAADWVAKACDGIRLGKDGSHLTARNNRLLNVHFGVYGQAYDSLVEYNEITNFSGDGVRATGTASTIQYNLIRNCYDVDDNHDDGIQGFMAYSSGSLIADVILRGNIIINRTDPDQPHQGPLQGIGCFDGPYRNWLVENNVVITDHWHGITFLGGEGCTVVNNTVFNPWYQSGASGYRTWIQIGAYKSGAKSNDCVVRNNIAHDVRVWSSENNNATVDSNVLVPSGDDPDDWFVDADQWNFHLVADAPAVDAGSDIDAPDLDADEFHRPAGTAIDAGAYEFDALPLLAADAGADQTLVDGDGDGFEMALLDGSASICLLGPAQYVWTRDEAFVGCDVLAAVPVLVGQTTYTLAVTALDTGDTDVDTVVVTVESAPAAAPGDANGDGCVNIDDFVILKNNFGSGSTWAEGDFNGDGAVDISDFVILKNNFGS